MLITCVAVLVLGPVLALANGFYTPTVGPRASAMGGAFIGLADDYSAVYWNPAGITQIKGMELTATAQDVITFASRDGVVRYYGDTEDRFVLVNRGATSEATNRIAPGAFFFTDAGPMRSVFDKVGIAAYTLTEYGSKWNGDDVFNADDFTGEDLGPTDFKGKYLAGDMQDYESRIKTYVFSPVFAKEVVPGLSVGLTANIAYSHFTLSDVYMETYVDTVEMPSVDDDYYLYLTPVQLTDDVTGWGYGATVGVLYRASRQVSAGVVFRSPMTISYDGVYSAKLSGGGEEIESAFVSDFEIKYPMWVGGGFAYRDFLFDGLTMTGDVQWTAWSSIDRIDRNIVWGGSWSEEELEALAEFETTEFNWEDTVEVGVGFDYRLGRSLSLSMGYRNSPSPVGDDDYYNFVLPQSSKDVVGAGVSYRQDFWRAAFSLEYHVGAERMIRETEDMNGKHLDDVLIPSLSFTYAF
jgi:long-chain fatty acid transport protein